MQLKINANLNFKIRIYLLAVPYCMASSVYNIINYIKTCIPSAVAYLSRSPISKVNATRVRGKVK